MSDGSDEKGPSSKAGAEPETQQRRRVRARQPTLLGVAAPSLAETIASVAKDAAAGAPPSKPAGSGRPGVPKPAVPLGRTAPIKREPARSEGLPSKLAPTVPRREPPKAKPKVAASTEPPAAPKRPKAAAPKVEIEPEIADLEQSPTHVGAAPETPREPGPAGFGGPPPESAPGGGFGAPALDEVDELSGESTQVGAPRPEEPSAEPQELASEATMPAVQRPQPGPPEPEHAMDEPARETPPPKELAVEPTVVVDPSLVGARQPESYRLDLRAGTLELTSEAPAPKRSGNVVALAVLGVIAALLVVGIGVTAALLLTSDDSQTVEPVATAPHARDPVDTPGDQEPVGVAAVPSREDDPGPAAATPALDEPAPEPNDEDEATGTDLEASGDEQAPPPTGLVVSRAELEAYELDPPRLSRRARRMSAAQRRRAALRFRTEGLRLYREQAYAEAEASFRQGLEHLPRDGAGCEGLARAIAQQSRFPEALAWAKLAIDRNPRSGAAYRVLGDIWRQAGHPDEAARAYRRGIARDPRDRWLRQRLRELAE